MAVHRGDLQLFTTPGAEVKPDGRVVGIADGKGGLILHGLMAKDHLIRLDREGFKPEETTVSLIGEIINSVTLQLPRIEAINEGQAQSPPDFRLARRLFGRKADMNGMLFTGPNELLTYGTGALLWDAQNGRQLTALLAD